MASKICNTCNTVKSVNDFNNDSNSSVTSTNVKRVGLKILGSGAIITARMLMSKEEIIMLLIQVLKLAKIYMLD